MVKKKFSTLNKQQYIYSLLTTQEDSGYIHGHCNNPEKRHGCHSSYDLSSSSHEYQKYSYTHPFTMCVVNSIRITVTWKEMGSTNT